ncbi:MAG: lysine biosynthesis protein LysX [Candidatus Nezhaarchaeota archaeon]|nr:lysine biosynthesis protein LysX [Candidatus Nezhaarchaeota archaeon]MCX8141497.1 lysine biosynthesis protein LysX [Candidatus Nezhaarchaeota archaeon]MDW8049764.1 lysine biosynthesis protein LysX [Nitrososphaerota archaeon]
MKVAILYDRLRWEEKAIFDALKSMNVETEMVDAKVEVAVLGKLKKLGDIVLNRCLSHFRGLYWAATLEAEGIRVINSFWTSLIGGDKLYTSLELAKAGIPTPRFVVAFTVEGALKALDEIGLPVVVKPVVGSWGRLLALIRDREYAKTIFEHREHLEPILHNIFYIQEYIDKPSRDVRSLVVGDEVITSIFRYAPEGEWRTNIALGGKAVACELTEDQCELVLKAAKAIKGEVVGVDCLESSRGLLVNEINTSVEFKGAFSATRVDIAGKIAEYVVREGKR